MGDRLQMPAALGSEKEVVECTERAASAQKYRSGVPTSTFNFFSSKSVIRHVHILPEILDNNATSRIAAYNNC